VAQIVAWLRQNLHPTALVTVGLQPSIVGGCIVRTPDHFYDFSLRRQFKEQLPSLVEDIRAASLKV
jgi:F0F1-type ATP synthase delta subunit